jgi:hypothetical protein
MWEGEGNIAVRSGGGPGGFAGAQATPVPQKPMDGLATKLHGLASDLYTLNERVGTLLNRLTGPQPASGSANADKPADPQGALVVAQFGAERIARQISELSDQISRLESIV